MNMKDKKSTTFKLTGILILITVMFVSCSGVKKDEKQSSNSQPVKNVIFLIGDGMGLSQIHAAMTANYGKLNIAKCNYIGLQKTSSADNYITDSAASGTALACGKKTKNGMIGMDSIGNELKSILKIAEEHDYGTGVLSTSAITHATPASFVANQISRNMYEEIAADFLETDLDVFIGGGSDHFLKRKDGRNLINELREQDYTVLFSRDSIKSFSGGKLAGFTAEGHNEKMSEGRGPLLYDAAKTALNILSEHRNGFFLMVEGSQIDWGGHANDQEYVIEETLDFDQVVGLAMDFADKNENTLVLVTADHETGGMTVLNGDYNTGEVSAAFTTGGHTGVMIPVFAYGSGADAFAGVYENTQIFSKIRDIMGFNN